MENCKPETARTCFRTLWSRVESPEQLLMHSGLSDESKRGLESTSDRVGWKVFCRRR